MTTFTETLVQPEIKSLHELEPDAQYGVLALTAAYTHKMLAEKPQMGKVTIEDMLGKLAVFIAFVGEDFAGIAAISQSTKHNGKNMVELGTLWVPQQFRGHGIGQSLKDVRMAYALQNNLLPYVFVNDQSQHMYEKGGDFKLALPTQIPSSAFELCKVICQPPVDGGCCDTVMIYAGEQS